MKQAAVVLTDNIVKIASLGDGIRGMLVQGSKVLTELSVGFNIKRVLLSEDCGQD